MSAIALITHDTRADVTASAQDFCARIVAAGFQVVMAESAADLADVELVVVFGGDGTILRAAEITRGANIPILGINYGHVGFLAEADPSSMAEVVEAIIAKRWTVDQRMTIDITVTKPNKQVIKSWALNELSVEKDNSNKTIETYLAVDGHGVSSFKADGVLFSTPTGSTAYNFSAGGPVVWPDLEAMLIVPLAAHALFTRPMVVCPESVLELRIDADNARVWADGRRSIDAPEGTVITVQKGKSPVLLAHLHNTPFSGRLVAKFDLPVQGWRNLRNELQND